MKANSDKSKQSNKATRRVLAGVLCGASVLSLVLSLVMPPISQAIANDGQTVSTEETVMGGGSSSESTDVENTNNGDTEKLNSDDAGKGKVSCDADAASLLSDDAGVEDAEQPADDDVNDEGDIALAAEDADQYTLINSANDLYRYLQSEKKTGKFRLNVDVEYASEITLASGDVTLDLNGHKIKHSGTESGKSNMSMFSVAGGATLTIEDLKQGDDSEYEQSGDKNGNLAQPDYSDDGTPNKLTYYVTKSNPNGTTTTETLYKHEVTISGAIVGTTTGSTMKLINVYAGGTFNLQSGVLTTAQDANVRHLIYAENGSNVNMSGGYVCGASMGRDGAGAGIHVEGSTLVISDGVIAGNYAPSGGGVYARNSTVNMVGGIISGNGTNNDQNGFGAGICAENSNVTITDGHITNNKYQHYDESHKGNGCHGGGGIAAFNGGSLTIAGGYITGNYSAEAGGGVYAGVWKQALSGFTFSGGIIASNVAQNSEGGGIRISAPTKSVFEVPIDSHADSHAYITNNTTNTSNDWGGGGVFVQGSGDNSVQPASLRISNALITNNHAKGFGGGFAACPTGKTAITDTDGIAIFGNSDEKGINRSGGTNGKSEDWDANEEVDNGGEITKAFINAGHEDLFLIHDSFNSENNPYIAAVTGQMLGGGAANWSGTIDKTPTSIGKYEGAQAKYMIGLAAKPTKPDKDEAIKAAKLFITGNRSNIHGGGIMTNGDVVAGSTTQVSVYPKMKLSGTKALTGRKLKKEEFKFQLLKQNKITKDNGEVSLTVPSFNEDKDGKLKLQLNGCSKIGDGVTNNADGSFAFDLGRVFSDDPVVYYLVEDPGDKPVSGVTYDKTIYKIEFETKVDQTQEVLDITYTYYSVDKVKVTNLTNGGSMEVNPPDGSNVSVKLTNGKIFTNDKTFTNAYTAKGSWTPQVTKKVDGGEMKRFKFELYTKNSDNTETSPQTKYTSAESGNSQIVTFDPVPIGPLGIKDFTNGEAKFTYYIRECDANEADGTKHEGYKNDTKRFKVVVTATDNGDGTLNCTPTYYEVDANNHESEKSTDDPTFTNIYSTSLPLSGMSGVTLTYLAGAAVLCAAAAWMHIRRKANAKGGKRRE